MMQVSNFTKISNLYGVFYFHSKDRTLESINKNNLFRRIGDLYIFAHGYFSNEEELTEELNSKHINLFHLLSNLYLKFGKNFVQKLQGSFIFIVYDAKNHYLIMARDPLGIKTLYYVNNAASVIFSDHIHNIIENNLINVEMNQEALLLYLTFQYNPSNKTLVKGIKKICPGTYIYLRENIEIREYWDVNTGKEILSNKDNIQAELKLSLIDKLDKITRYTTTGAFCSGGIDSTTNIVLLKMLNKTCIALTASFEQGYDESYYASIVAKHFNLEHKIESCTKNDIFLIEELSTIISEPIADQALLPTYKLLKINKNYFNLLLSGEGGDELWGLPRRCENNNFLMSDALCIRSLASYYSELTSCNNEEMRINLLKEFDKNDIINTPIDFLESLYRKANTKNVLELLKYGQLKTWLPENVLAKDRSIATYFNLDVCFPLIDLKIVEIIMGLETNKHYESSCNKTLLRELIFGEIPEIISEKPKHKFLVPFHNWITTDVRFYIRDILLSQNSLTGSLYNKQYILHLLTNWNSNYSRPIWSMMMLELWWRKIVSIRPTMTKCQN